jgi:hypothetical protein
MGLESVSDPEEEDAVDADDGEGSCGSSTRGRRARRMVVRRVAYARVDALPL